MASKGLYFKDVQPLIEQGHLEFIGNSDLLQVVQPCAAVSRRPALRRKSPAHELVELEEEIAIEKGILLAPQWRAANPAEQQRLAGLPEAELRAWGIRNEKGEVRVKVLSQIKDLHAAIRQSLRHIPRSFLGQEIKLNGRTLSLPGRFQALAQLGEEFLDLNASIMDLANAQSAAAEEIIAGLGQLCEKISAAIKDLEALSQPGRPRAQELSAAALSRLLIDLRIMEKYLRRAEELIAFDKTLKETISRSYEKLMEMIAQAQEKKLADRDLVKAHGVYKLLAEQIHVNPYYAERIACPELQRLGQIKGRSPRTALNYIKSAAFKLEAVALPIMQRQALQKQAYYQRSIKEFSLKVPACADLSALLKSFAETAQQALKSETIVIFLNDVKSHSYTLQEKRGLPDDLSEAAKFSSGGGLIRLLAQENKVWRRPEVDAQRAHLKKQERAALKACQARLLVPMRAKDELIAVVGVGGRRFREDYDQTALAFLLDLSNQAALAIEGLQLRRQHRARQQELEAAREIQRNLLPRSIPQIQECEVAALCESCLEVGGDYYDLLKFSDHKVGLLIADVVGKGAPAALLMSNLQAAVKILITEDAQPSVLVEKVNRLICGSITPNRYITFFYGVLDTDEKVLTYTNAGHNPPLLLRADGSQVELGKGGTVIGIIPQSTYEQERITLNRSDLLILYTDGVTEARNAAGEEFGEAGLCQQVLTRKWGTVEELLQQIHQSVRAFAQGEMQDDLTLVLVSIR